MEHVVQVTRAGRVYTFRAEQDGPLNFWRIDTPGRDPIHTELRALGTERPEFFRRVLDAYTEPEQDG